jgi:hypothetical protein
MTAESSSGKRRACPAAEAAKRKITRCAARFSNSYFNPSKASIRPVFPFSARYE